MIYEFKEQDAYDFARHIGAKSKPYGDELRFTQYCPYCNGGKNHDRDTFSINLKTGQFKCMRSSCSVHGNMLTLARDFDFSLGIEADEYYRPRQQYRKLKTPDRPVEPKPEAVKYLLSRGISERIAKKYEVTIHSKQSNVLVFPFYDERGLLQYIKYRDTEHFKGKTYINVDGETKNSPKEWMEKDCKPILFGMKQCNDKFDRLVITEGQLDSLSVAESGIENATSVPGGMNNWRWVPYCWNWMCQFEEIVVFGDFEKGHMTLLEDIKRRFPNKIRYVQEKDYQGYKDANALLLKSGKDAVRRAVENATFVPVQRVIPLADVKNVNIYELEKMKTGICELDTLLYGGFHFGQVVLVAGKRGDGKSTFASQIFSNAIDQGYASFAYSGELPNYMFKAWLDFQVAGRNHITENIRPDGSPSRFITNKNQAVINEWYRDKAYIYDSRIIDGDEQEDLIKTITNAVMQYGIRVVLIDNLMTALDLDLEKSSDRYERQGNFVKKLEKMALRMDILIILVAHRRKNGFTTDANDEISGSADITNAAGVVLSYDRDKELPQTQRKLITSKSRLIGRLNFEGSILEYDEKSKRIVGNGDDLNRQYGWDKSDGFAEAGDMELPFD